MSVNLIFTNESANDNQGESNWGKITAIAPEHGMVFIGEETVTEIAKLLDDAVLSNGEKVEAYAMEDYPALVCAHGPALLGEDSFRQIRTLLEEGENGQQAVALFDLVVELGLQISLSGKEFCDAHIKAINWAGDDIKVNRAEYRMMDMFERLGLGSVNNPEDHASDLVPIEQFIQAVNDNGFRTDMPERLQAFADCAQRNKATHVYWA